MPATDFGAFLSRSLETLRTEMPPSYARLCASMQGQRVSLVVDGDAVTLSFDRAQHEVGPPSHRPPDVEVILSKQTILDLLDGRESLEDAIWSDRFFVRPPVGELDRFFEALSVYLRGAVRCPSMPQLSTGYRASLHSQPREHYGHGKAKRSARL